MVKGKPAADVSADASLVRALLAEQHPDLAGLPLSELGSGWDNAIFRLGDTLTVRLPRRQLGADLAACEQRWLPQLAPSLPLPVPAPVRTGTPGCGYPWSWSICPWLPGEVAVDTPPGDLERAARALGGFLSALHRPAPADAPRNPYRGVPLADRAPHLDTHLLALDGHVNSEAIRERFAAGLETPAWSAPPVWVHGDLHPMNMLVHEGRLSAVIDFGDLTAGDPATDLSVAWFFLPRELHPVFRTAAGALDDATWSRARTWALCLSIAWLSHAADDPRMWDVGQRALRAVLAES